jgi:hypothetical protein
MNKTYKETLRLLFEERLELIKANLFIHSLNRYMQNRTTIFRKAEYIVLLDREEDKQMNIFKDYLKE